jgi:hypothetical protein
MTLRDRIAAYFGYVRREYQRIDNGADAIMRGGRWEDFYREKDGLADMLGNIRRSYFEKVGQLKLGDTDALMALGMADRIVRQIEGEVIQVIETGKIARSNAEHAERVAATRR